MVFQLIMAIKNHRIKVLYLANKYQLYMNAYNLYSYILRKNTSLLLRDSIPLRVYCLFVFLADDYILYFGIHEDDTNIQMRSHYLSSQGLV